MLKNAFVSGASRGIGRAIATSLAADGYHLYLTCLHSFSELESLKNELETAYSIHCHIFLCDMSDYNQVSTLFQSIDTLDLLINNAGISYVGLLSEMSATDWHQIMDTNISSCFYTSKYTIPLMLQKKQGRIINISSVWGNAGASMEVAYSSSKGAVNSFTKALAKELAPSNIQVNAIACGIIDTDMNRCFNDSEIAQLVEEIPADCLGSVEDVARLVLLLAKAPAYLTGQVITLDGGWM